MCFRSGAFAAVLVISLCVGGISSLFGVCLFLFGSTVPVSDTPLLIVGYGFGASFVALFMQLGGGIFTKAADVGADLVGKVEVGIPEGESLVDILCFARQRDFLSQISTSMCFLTLSQN